MYVCVHLQLCIMCIDTISELYAIMQQCTCGMYITMIIILHVRCNTNISLYWNYNDVNYNITHVHVPI